MDFRIFATTSKGSSHSSNEDTYAVGRNYLIIADGMGGAAAGQIASEIVVRTISECLDKASASLVSEPCIRNIVTSSIEKATIEINRYVASHPDSDGMGSTVLVIVMYENIAHIAWCGDSRCYVSNSERTQSLTKDHSYVRSLIDNNLITEEESFSHPDNNIITRCVGAGNDTAQPDFLTYTLKPGERLIACSDGLSGYCRDNEIHKTVTHCSKNTIIPKKLTELALRRGSDDDITIAVITAGPHRNPITWKSFTKWLKHM